MIPANPSEQWVEEIDFAELLKEALAAPVWDTRREEHWLVTDNDFWLKPQFVKHAHTESATRTATNIEVAHPSLLTASCFEYQHSISEESATDSIREGLIR